ncbi:hypothetical protein QQ045_013635 [Rhodiola kirilowii]
MLIRVRQTRGQLQATRRLQLTDAQGGAAPNQARRDASLRDGASVDPLQVWKSLLTT